MVRLMYSSDDAEVRRMMRELWPADTLPEGLSKEHIFVWEKESGRLGGFSWVQVRQWVEGAQFEPCPHVEGWYVEPDLRKQGIGKELIRALEAWAKGQGFNELTSDVEMENEVSLKAHEAIGFTPTSKIQYFRKEL